jgi:outer membrane receptor protein involved in Fe transport
MRLLPLASLLLLGPVLAGAAPLPEEIVVTAQRRAQPSLELIGNTARIDAAQIGLTGHKHPYEIGVQAPGTWISRGTQQEHLTAIRSPVLTGPGACGSFLVLEDGIPIRPAGFCNVNQLFEVPSEQAVAIEVLRGPANALYGSNGLHGTLNFLLPEPGRAPGLAAAGEAGPNGYWRGQLLADGELGGRAVVGGLMVDRDGDFRDEAGYRQAKAFAKLSQPLAGGGLELGFSGTVLDQETAGFIIGRDSYRDPELRRVNPNPESYRKANSQRLSARWLPDPGHALEGLDLRLFLRRSDMDFLQHFLVGQPREENGQLSGGMLLTHQSLWRERMPLTVGLDLELARGWLREVQAGPVTEGSAFIRETRPAGKHYDYRVASWLVAPYAQLELPLAPRWTLQAGLRAEYLRYDYDNRMLDGNTRDDGTPCGFGGCLYNRPADRQDGFLNVAPNLGLLFRVSGTTSAFANLVRGFRPPQATELYRLQSGQQVADLDSESLDSIEIGLRRQTPGLRTEVVGFAMDKRDYILRDADGFNVSAGKSRHLGLELSLDLRLPGEFYAAFAGTWARQTYRFDRIAAQAEVIRSGNDVDTAPRTLASARLGWDGDGRRAELEWVHIGSYWLDAANTAKYRGHELLNLRLAQQLPAGFTLTARVNNLTDKLVADRADFAFGNYRYFPARDRELYIELAWRR